MTKYDEQLPDAHLSEDTLVALADGQDGLPASVSDHLVSCDACTERLMEAASLSVQVGEMLRAALPHEAALPEPRALPWTAVGLALALAACGVLPVVRQLPLVASRLAPSLAHALPVVVHGLSLALTHGGVGAAYMTVASAVVLMALGVAVSRAFDHEGAAS
jgi:hypothetical protein